MKNHIDILINFLCCNPQFLQQKVNLYIFQSSRYLIINEINTIHFQKPNINLTKSFCLCQRIIYYVYMQADYY
jgi:hypothetical protein